MRKENFEIQPHSNVVHSAKATGIVHVYEPNNLQIINASKTSDFTLQL